MNLSEFEDKKFIDKGTQGKCYLLQDGNVVKIFDYPRNLSQMRKLKRFKEYENESFVFPIDFIYNSKKFYGYITKYVPGKAIDDVFSKKNLLDLSKHSFKLEKNIDFVSSGGIKLNDFHAGNLIYDGNKFVSIDHDDDEFMEDIDLTKEENRSAHRILIGKLFLRDLENFDWIHTKLIRNSVREYMYSKMPPSEMIIGIKEKLDKEYKEDIKKMEDIKSIVRR